jgi:hypothetical protein
VRQLFEHLCLPAGIVVRQIFVDEWSVNTGWRDTVATNVMRQIVAGNGIGHRDHRALAHRIGEAIGQPRGSRDGSHIDYYAASGTLHVADNRVHAVIKTFDVDVHDAIKILWSCRFHRSDVRNARIIHQNVNSGVPCEVVECSLNLDLIRDVACVCKSGATVRSNLLARFLCCRLVEVKNVDSRSARRELQSNRSSNATAATGDQGGFAIKSKPLSTDPFLAQSDTPRFQGIKSSWAFNSALVRISPLATLTVKSRICSPIC